MPVTAKWFGNAFLKALNKEIDWDSDTIKVMLCTSAYTPDQDAHEYKDDVTNEVTDEGYTAGGKALSNKAITYDPATNKIVMDADDTVWTNASITARYAVIYDDAGTTDAEKVLLGYVDFGQDMISSSSDFTIEWSANGIFAIMIS